MLEKLLQEIRAGGSLETNRLAARLNTSPQIVQAMLEHLGRAGYIQSYTACAQGCSGCGLSDACLPRQEQNSARIWQSPLKS